MRHIDRLPFPNLLTELKNYSEDKALEIKVKRIHALCVKSKRFILADKILRKYPQYFKASDLSIAFGWSLAASRK